MIQIPRYIICLHEILAHTPHNHVERKSLYEAQTILENLSQVSHQRQHIQLTTIKNLAENN